ncbi:maleylpyruvate isomerase family mycothiol-dependent enzyme [Aestuariimicrobium ganziense]|uniref:maleylpyruvate isomerase family mycothiol-dependent enzyme n=1 Tax=Aestuariimicrobium ganziense TaxID=2773677 RepID=UPI001942E7CF|nr:maleylpyruvate isomerase family mycothiol-dependent enzyme [Aestuariimicrobium ganziense]
MIRTESDRFASVLATTDAGAPVPSCPEWTADDLLWHLTEVHLFWSRIIGDRVTEVDDEAAFAAGNPPRPDGREALLDLRTHATDTLLDALGQRSDDEQAWSWFEDDQTVGFTHRMQTHEATIHRVDAELTAGVPISPIAAAVAAEGIDHSIDVMRGGVPDWATLTPAVTAVLRATDTGQTWTVEVGRWSGIGPQSGNEFDEPFLRRAGADSPAPTAEASGTVEQLDLWMWGRPSEVVTSGDEDAVARLVTAAAAPLQ